MGPKSQLVLLAVVLLEFAVGTEDDRCGRGRSDCEVAEVRGGVATLECGAAVYQRTEEITTSPVTSGVAKLTTDYQTTVRVSSDDESVRTFNLTEFENETTTDFYLEESEVNKTSTENILGSEKINEEASSTISITETHGGGTNKVTYKEDITTEQTRYISDAYVNKHFTAGKVLGNWVNITTVEVNLLRNAPVLDISPFYNATTVILKTSGYSSFNICASSHVLSLFSVSSGLKEINFTRNLKNLESLNLAHNKIEKITIPELPLSLKSLDLSYNRIIFDTNLSLPDNLQILNVSYNNISASNTVYIRGNLLKLDMRENSLLRIPVLNMTKLEELYLSANNISTLKEGVFSNITSLTVLDLRRNHLTSLDERVFLGLNKLQWLDMSENQFTSLAPATFQYINNLVTLSLSGNTNLGNVQDIEDASFLFGAGQRLQTIEASRTNLTRIPSTLTRSVRKLLLAYNAISNIQCGELDSFPLLQTMDMSSNLVAEIEEDAFGRLEFLSHLLLSNNKLKSIPKSLPSQLQVFDLRCNVIEKLFENDFLGLQKLRVLLLSKNKISLLEDGAFGQLSSLEVLDLSHNPIKSLSRTSFIGPRRLKEIYLVSLKDLIPLQEPLSFPAPESAHLEVLNMESSPVLANQLMDDVAALTMFHELFELNLNHCRLSTLRSDLPKYLPRLHKLELTGNVLNCTNIIWLVKWLQALNISMQDTGRFRREIYNLKDICCKEAGDESYDAADVICASPEYLSGKEIISLKEEDFPDLKLTSSTVPPPRQVFITEHYLAQTSADSARNASQTVSAGVIDPTSKTTLSVPDSTQSSSTELPRVATSTLSSYENQVTKPTLLQVNYETTNIKKSNNAIQFDKTKPKKSVKTAKSLNREVQKWKYLKSETKYKLSTADPIIVLLNGSKSVEKDFDNQLNDSISSGAYLSHEHPPASHPGMVVFLVVASVILVAAAAMIYSHCSQHRRGPAYHQQQDIEVSSFGGNDLW